MYNFLSDKGLVRVHPKLNVTRVQMAGKKVINILFLRWNFFKSLWFSFYYFFVVVSNTPTWYSRKVCRSRNGTGVTTFVEDNVFPFGCILSAIAAASFMRSSLSACEPIKISLNRFKLNTELLNKKTYESNI